jgi:hypothetical protein
MKYLRLKIKHNFKKKKKKNTNPKEEKNFYSSRKKFNLKIVSMRNVLRFKSSLNIYIYIYIYIYKMENKIRN